MMEPFLPQRENEKYKKGVKILFHFYFSQSG